MTMLNPKDIANIEERGSNRATVEEQIENFKKGFPFLKIAEAATTQNGILKLKEEERTESIRFFENKINEGIRLLKFTPASGAASRMFKDLFEAKNKLEQGVPEKEVLSQKEVARFFSNLNKFAFYNSLKRKAQNPISELSPLEILNLLMTEDGLNYGSLPKGLLEFHESDSLSRTSFEEHCVEGALYAKEKDGEINIHFTVSPEHQTLFNLHLKDIRTKIEAKYEAHFNITFSQQKPTTDTIAVTPDDEPFRNDDGSLLFRPGGHGALLTNLNDLDADVVFIKNIDNVVPDYLKPETVKYKKVLGGLLLSLQQKIFSFQRMFDTHHYYALDSAFFAEASNFLENILHVKPPFDMYYTEKEELYHYLKLKYNRPIRVCGMVRNQGEPGGGPFFALNSDDSVSLQIVESSQIDINHIEQKSIIDAATHFNPVDLVCAYKNYKGEKYDLFNFRDQKTGFISKKYKDGKELKAQELPGLWNGAMADWNTLFVEVPIQTFNPVKTINDLLRKEHQPE